MKKIVKYIMFCIELPLLFIVVGGLTSAITKYIYADILIEQFKKKATLDEEESTASTKVYKIPSNEQLSACQKKGNSYYPGNKGDILISLQSGIGIPFVEDIITFFAGGHAGLILDDYQDANVSVDVNKVLESSGMDGGENLSGIGSRARWLSSIRSRPVIGLRIQMTEEQRSRVIARAMALVGEPYNYSFLFDTKNKSYCSDLEAKAFDTIGVDLNKDGFTTSVYDLLLSGETYICYYHYVDSNQVQHIYYLE